MKNTFFPDDYVEDPDGDGWIEVESDIDDDLNPSPQEEQLVSGLKLIKLTAAIDAEWSEKGIISFQAHLKSVGSKILIDFKFIVIDKSFRRFYKKKQLRDLYLKYKFHVYFESFSDFTQDSILTHYIINILELYYDFDLSIENTYYFNLTVYLYYSFKDLIIAFGLENMKPYMLGEKTTLRQTKYIRGFLFFKDFSLLFPITFKIFIKDLCQLRPGSLKDLALSCGIEVGIKTVLDDYKASMHLAVEKEPYLFIHYALNDTTLLYTCLESKLTSYNEILSKVYLIPSSEFFTESDLPLSRGSTVNQIFLKYLKHIFFQNDKALIYSLLKLSVIDPCNKLYDKNLDVLKILSEINSLTSLQALVRKNSKKLENFESLFNENGGLLYTPYEYASKKFLVNYSKNNNLIISAFSSGGRTINERPQECKAFSVGDIDISGAYGGVLERSLYPIGKPRYYCRAFNQQKTLTLGGFFQKYGKDLEKNNLYKLTVTGNLSFDQDLLFSRQITDDYIKEKPSHFNFDDRDTYALKSHIYLCRREISNAVITHSTWEILNKISSNNELKEFKELTLDTAIFWLDSDRASSLENLADLYLKDTGEYTYNTAQQTMLDTRTHAWFPVDLSNFLSPLNNKRKELKKLKNDPQANIMQTTIKDIVNTFWGILTSMFFSINNVVISDIVTDTIRVNMWQITKALNTFQSITDGGPYCFNQVSFLNTTESSKLPGCDYLSSFYKLKTHRSIKIGPLGGLNWDYYFEENIPMDSPLFPNIDKLAQEHIVKFWKNYDIEITFDTAHKNVCKTAAFMCKAHYIFLLYNKESQCYDELFHKIRGFHLDNNIEHQNPIYGLLCFIIKNDLDKNDIYQVPNNSRYTTIKLIKLLLWRKSLVREFTKKNGKLEVKKVTQISKYGPEVFPGDAVVDIREFRLNNTHFPISTYAEYKKRNFRSLRAIKNGDEYNNIIKSTVPLFEKYLSVYGILVTLKLMACDNLRKAI